MCRSRLDVCLRIGEEGPSIGEFNLDHALVVLVFGEVVHLQNGDGTKIARRS